MKKLPARLAGMARLLRSHAKILALLAEISVVASVASRDPACCVHMRSKILALLAEISVVKGDMIQRTLHSSLLNHSNNVKVALYYVLDMRLSVTIRYHFLLYSFASLVAGFLSPAS